MQCLSRIHPSPQQSRLLGASSEDISEVPCAGLFQNCDAYVMSFLVFDEFLIFFSSGSLVCSCQGLRRLFVSFGCRAPYYETTDAGNMEFDIVNEKFNGYMELELKTGNNKFPPS